MLGLDRRIVSAVKKPRCDASRAFKNWVIWIDTNTMSGPDDLSIDVERHLSRATPEIRPVAEKDELERRAFKRARRHSGIVRLLRIALPLGGVFIIATLFGAYLWSQSGIGGIDAASVSMEGGRMVMRNPHLTGTDERERPYSLKAREAIQDPAKPSAVELIDIDATVPVQDGISARILAGNGQYDANAKTLKLTNSVDVTADDGSTITLQDADIDMGAGTMHTANPVSMRTEQAEISAQRLAVEDNGQRIVFEERVRMTIYPEKVRAAQEQGVRKESSENNRAQ